MKRRAICAAALAGAASVTAQQNMCFVNFGNSSFNLEKLVAQTPYTIQDASNNRFSRNYTYVFNFCKNVDPLSFAMQQYQCNTTYPGAGYVQPAYAKSGPGAAFQVANGGPGSVSNGDACHRLGDAIGPSTVSYGLIDPSNPSRGIYVQYGGGDTCPGIGSVRALKVWIPCDPDAQNIPDDELVEEYNCLYEVWFKSAYGCPAECPVVQSPDTGAMALCGGHGICEFDANVGNSRCFCNDGFLGSDCTQRAGASSGLSTVGAMLVVVCIFLVMTLSFLGYLWFRIRSLRLDPAAYSALRGGPGEDAPSATIG